MIAVIDYKTGNLRSVKNALSRLGGDYVVTGDADVIRAASHVILPGVGEAGQAMSSLRESGLVDVILGLTQPVLGICIGMQLMCCSSQEGNTKCMGIFDTDVVKMEPAPGLKVPHMGWDTIEKLASPLFSDMQDGAYVYYVHSFAPELCGNTVAVTDYGTPFSAALQNRNFFGTQFHPEKSGPVGGKILTNFVSML